MMLKWSWGWSGRESLQWIQFYSHTSTVLFLSLMFPKRESAGAFKQNEDTIYLFIFLSLFHSQNGTTGVLHKKQSFCFSPWTITSKSALKKTKPQTCSCSALFQKGLCVHLLLERWNPALQEVELDWKQRGVSMFLALGVCSCEVLTSVPCHPPVSWFPQNIHGVSWHLCNWRVKIQRYVMLCLSKLL